MAELTDPSRSVFDRAITLAYIRWEILRRTATYRRQVRELIKYGAESFFDQSGSQRWDEERLTEWVLRRWDGEIPVPADRVSKKTGLLLSDAGRRLHAQVLKTTGLRSVLHYSVVIPMADMTVLPIFSDTPGRQPSVVDQALLRRLVRHPGPNGAIPHRPLHRAIQRRPVAPTGFVIRGRRIHSTFDRDMKVFDYRVQGWRPCDIAAKLELREHEERQAWTRACDLIGDVEIEVAQPGERLWVEVAEHCDACGRFVAGEGEPCPANANRLGLGSTGQRDAIRPELALDLIAARVAGALPARSRRASGSVAPDEDAVDL